MPKGVDYVPPAPEGRKFRARDAIIMIAVAMVLLILFKGDSVKTYGETLKPGVGRGVVVAVGAPTAWIAEQLPLADLADDATSWLASGDDLTGDGGFTEPSSGGSGNAASGPISPSSFDPGELHQKVRKRELKKILVTGDSMAQPMDAVLAQRLEPDGVEVERDVHQGTAISNPKLLNWAKLAQKQAKEDKADALVMVLGGAEGFDLEDARGEKVECCGPDYAALYADRVRQLMNTFRRAGKTKVYWLSLPTARDKGMDEVVDMVNASLDVASVPYRRDVRIVDLGEVFTPGDKFRSAMDIDGRDQIVRETDGFHLTEAGAKLAADALEDALDKDFNH
jgi:lysophospholipase L1-like esterase